MRLSLVPILPQASDDSLWVSTSEPLPTWQPGSLSRMLSLLSNGGVCTLPLDSDPVWGCGLVQSVPPPRKQTLKVPSFLMPLPLSTPLPRLVCSGPRGQLDLFIALQEHMIKASRDAVPSIPGWGQVMGENRISREQNGGRERWALLPD